MSWFNSRPKNQLHRHDLRGLDGKLRTRIRQHRQSRMAVHVITVAVLAAGIVWLVWLGMRQSARKIFTENAAYQVTDIAVENSGMVLKPSFVVSYLDLHRGQNLLSLDLGEFCRKLEQLPMVDRAEVGRELPGRLFIRITERVPIANISYGTGSARYQIDRQGVVMNLEAFAKDSEDFQQRIQALPTITGAKVADLRIGRTASSPEVTQALALIQQIDKAELRCDLDVEEINVCKRGMLQVRTAEGVLLKIGLSSMRRQLSRLATILQDARQNALRIATVDLTVAGNDVPVTFLPSSNSNL
jgi:cell division septal protein FtsQ